MKNLKIIHKQNSGFTIVELMIAVSVFSMILLLTTVGMVQISKAYYKGIVQATTQQTARNVINSVAQNVQFSSFSGIIPGVADKSASYGSGYVIRSFCIGDQQQYSYVTGYQQSASRGTGTTEPVSEIGYSSKHVLWQSAANPSCAPANLDLADPGAGKELLEEKMRLTNFKIESDPAGNDPSLFKVSVTIMYGDEDLIDKTGTVDPANPMKHWRCKATSGVFTSAFCAKSEQTTIVGKRLSLGIE